MLDGEWFNLTDPPEYLIDVIKVNYENALKMVISQISPMEMVLFIQFGQRANIQGMMREQCKAPISDESNAMRCR